MVISCLSGHNPRLPVYCGYRAPILRTLGLDLSLFASCRWGKLACSLVYCHGGANRYSSLARKAFRSRAIAWSASSLADVQPDRYSIALPAHALV